MELLKCQDYAFLNLGHGPSSSKKCVRGPRQHSLKGDKAIVFIDRYVMQTTVYTSSISLKLLL